MRSLAENYATPPATLTNHAIFNLNQLLILLSSSTEDSKFNGSSAQDVLNSAFAKIKEWVHSLIHKFDELFPPEKVHHWLWVALPYLIVITLCLICCCAKCFCRCLKKGVWRKCCCGGRKMMKAPGRGSIATISRNRFEGNPRSYFQNLRSGESVELFY